MKLNVFAVLLSLIVLLAFQNCNTSHFNSDRADQTSSSTVTGQQIEKLNYGTLHFGAMQMYAKTSKVIEQNGQQYQVRMNEMMELNLDTGAIVVSNDYDESVKTYCWPADKLNEIKNLLGTLEFCRYTKSLPSDVACAQIYKLPYARLIASSQDIDLGAFADSCESSTIDVCDEKKETLLIYVTELQTKHSQFSCQ